MSWKSWMPWMSCPNATDAEDIKDPEKVWQFGLKILKAL